MSKQPTNKKPSALSRAKSKIQSLESKLNVALDDNIVTHEELKTLKVYKAISIVAVSAFIILLASLFV